MSQHSAARSATARKSRRAAQILRHTAVVTAGMASIGLTVAAGTYIAQEMSVAQRTDAIIAAPPGPYQPSWHPALGEVRDHSEISPIAENIGLASIFTVLPRESEVRVSEVPASTATDPQQADSPGLTGKLRVGNTYVGAQVVPVLRNSIAVTLDTNVFGTLVGLVLPEGVSEQLGIGPTGTTRVHTEFDTKRGEVTLVVSDSALGKFGVQLARHPAPATSPARPVLPEQTEATPQSDAVDVAATDTAVSTDSDSVPEHSGTPVHPEPVDTMTV